MSQPETVLVNRIRREILREFPEAWILKVAGGPYQTAGVPDLLICLSGRLLALEVKRQHPGESAEHARGRATLQQQAQIEKIQRAGGVAAVVLTPDEALAVIRETGLQD